MVRPPSLFSQANFDESREASGPRSPPDRHRGRLQEGFRESFGDPSDLSINIQPDDEKMLKLIAMTSMSTKATVGTSEHLASLATKAISQIMEERDGKITADIDRIKVLKKKGESMEQSELIKGIVVDKEISHPQMPKQVRNAKIALSTRNLRSRRPSSTPKSTLTLQTR